MWVMTMKAGIRALRQDPLLKLRLVKYGFLSDGT
jgi:hypothetical protein